MIVKEIFSNNGIHLHYKYFGITDFATYFELNSLLEHLPFVIDTISKLELTCLDTIDNLKDFIFIKKISLFAEIKSQIKHDYQQDFGYLLKYTNNILNNFTKKDIIKCINQSYQDFFTEKDNYDDFYSVIFDYMISFQTGISEKVFLLFAKKKKNYILNNFGKLGSIKYNIEFFNEILPPSFSLKEAKELGLNRVFSIFSNILTDKLSPFKENINIFLDRIINEEIEILNNEQTVITNIMHIESEYRIILSFLKKIKHHRTFQLQKYQNHINSILDNHLLNHGQSFSFTLQIQEILMEIKNIENWQLKILMLTHEYREIDKKFRSILSCKSKGKQHIIDYVSSNIPTNEYFTFSHQQFLELIYINGAAIIQSLWHDSELYPSLKTWYRSILIAIDESIESGENLADDINIAFALLDCILLGNNKDQDLLIANSYGACIFICAMIEKLLRVIFIDINSFKGIYVPVEYIQLGSLLNSLEIKNILGENHTKTLLFYLGHADAEHIGYNIRNSLAHLTEYNLKNITPLQACSLFYIYTDILNSIMLNRFYSDHYIPE